MVAGRNPAADGIAPDRSGITTNSPSDRSGEWAWKRAGAPRPVPARVPARAARKGWLGCNSSNLAGYHGIKVGLVSLATEAGRMAGLPIWKETCSNARAGSKRVAYTECVASSASRSSLLWVHECHGLVVLLVARQVVARDLGRVDSSARYGRASGIVTGISWQSLAMVPFAMGADIDGQPFDKGRIRGLQKSSQGIKQASPWPKTGGESRHSHSLLHRGASGCLGRPPWQRWRGFTR